MKVGVVASLSGEYNYFGIPIHNGAILALQEAIDAGDELEIVVVDDRGQPARTRQCLDDLDRAGVVAVIGPVESHCAAIGAEEAASRRLPVLTPSATASYLTIELNKWFFRAISPDRDRADALARWAKQDLHGEPILVIHEVTPPDEVGSHPQLYGESAGHDFVRALGEGSQEPYPYERVTFERDDVLSRALKQECARLLRSGSVGAAAIFTPTANIIEIGTYLRQQRADLPLYIISPGRDLIERSSLRDGLKAITDTLVEDADDPDVAAFRERYCSVFPDDTEDPVAQYATFAYDAGRIVVEALRTDDVRASASEDIKVQRDVLRKKLRSSPPRSDLLMSPGNFVLNNDLFFKFNRRVLRGGRWNRIDTDELRKVLPTNGRSTSTFTAASNGFDVFLSYRHGDPDEKFTRELRRRLRDAGFKVAFDRTDFFPAYTFLEEMERCIKESRFIIVVISPRYFESGNTQEEAIITQVLGMDELRRKLIPCTFEVAKLPAWLHAIVGIDFSRDDPDVDPYDRLISTLHDPRGFR